MISSPPERRMVSISGDVEIGVQIALACRPVLERNSQSFGTRYSVVAFLAKAI
jgi:hypothetical protein